MVRMAHPASGVISIPVNVCREITAVRHGVGCWPELIKGLFVSDAAPQLWYRVIIIRCRKGWRGNQKYRREVVE